MIKEVTIVLSDGINFEEFAHKCRRKCRARRRSSRSQLITKGYIAGVEDVLSMLREELEKITEMQELK